MLFLDEPTTGLDPQSRTALWDEVARLSRDDGVTVFLTTQYLEEADVLADRVGIIDHGRSSPRARRPPTKAEISRPSVHDPVRGGRPAPYPGAAASVQGAPRRRRARGPAARGISLADVVRGVDAEGVVLDDIELRAPTLDDVFLAKTGRTLEGAAEADGG